MQRTNHLAVAGITALLAVLLASASPARADSPSWMRGLTSASLPKYPEDTKAVVLLDEQIVTIKENGEIHSVIRRAYKILTTSGRDRGTMAVFFDSQTKLLNLKAWSIPPTGKEYELKEKDAVEANAYDGLLYSDLHFKALKIPASEPGSIIGYEYEQLERADVLQNVFSVQGEDPVRLARFTLQLPRAWEYEARWLHSANVPAQNDGNNQWHWELHDIPALAEEPEMPSVRALAGRLVLNYFPSDASLRQKTFGSWQAFGRWYGALVADRRDDTPDIRQKVAELTAASASPLDKMHKLAEFAQRQIRYVAIEIGIGGYQPHPASAIFTNRYGDCKDKATLLATMLKDIGINSYYVVIHTSRGIVAPDNPPESSFNHVILAIRVPDDVPTTELYSLYRHPLLGTLLFFDPTNEIVPLGYLPSYLQANYGMLVTDDGGELVELPLLPATTNRLDRTAKFTLDETGTLSGAVEEVRSGDPATRSRERLLDATAGSRSKVLEGFLSSFLAGSKLAKADVSNLDDYNKSLVLNYTFSADRYAQRVGNLLLVRPRVLGQKSNSLLEGKERKYPVELNTATLETDTFEIALPPGYVIDELPPATTADYSFARYSSKVESDAKVLRYTRTYEVKSILIGTEQLPDLKKLYEQIARDESSSAVLKRAAN